MIVGAVSGRGVFPLKKVPSNVKINTDNYIKYVLKPILEIEVPKIYPNELNKLFFMTKIIMTKPRHIYRQKHAIISKNLRIK
jgi:hypothetical protein